MEHLEMSSNCSTTDPLDMMVHLYTRDPRVEFRFYIGSYRCESTMLTNSLAAYTRAKKLKKLSWMSRAGY